MPEFFDRLDRLAGIESGTMSVRWLERIAFLFLILTAVSAPHSIAATQTAWLTGMFVWFIGAALRWRSGTLPTGNVAPRGLHIALWAFFGWSILTAVTSYAPDISINKLRGVAVFLIFYFVVYNLKNLRAAHLLAFVLIGSTMVNVLWVPIERLIGRGVEIHGLAHDGPLAKALLWEGDTLLEANGAKLRSPEDVLEALDANETTRVKFYRPDFEFVVEVKRADLLEGADAMSRIGISNWKKSRNWRSSGFYGHYTTYAEVLQLIGSLVLGLFVAHLGLRKGEGEKGSTGESELDRTDDARTAYPRPFLPFLPFSFSPLLLLGFFLAAISLALLLTVTRASQLAFLISGAVIVLVGLGRRWFLAGIAIAVPIALIGVFFLQQSRQVGFFDPNDDSIKWRQTVWREGFELWTANPRNFVLGVGMDSIKRFAPEWHLFDDARLNMGHFHSTPLNLVVERGLPALLLWLAVLGIYARTLWRALFNQRSKFQDPRSLGILLGSLGGLVGFFVSGLVHYNLGDQEVAMVFFLLMGLSVRIGSLRSADGLRFERVTARK